MYKLIQIVSNQYFNFIDWIYIYKALLQQNPQPKYHRIEFFIQMKNDEFNRSVSDPTTIDQKPTSTDIICSQHNIALYACLNNKCLNYAFLCNNHQCQCRKRHTKCLIVLTDTIVNSLKGKIISPLSLERCIEEGFQKIIDEMSDIRDGLLKDIKQKFRFMGLNNDEADFLNKLNLGKVQDITGSQIWKAHLDFNKESNHFKEIEASIGQINDLFTVLKDQMKETCLQIRQIVDEYVQFDRQQESSEQSTILEDKSIRLPFKGSTIVTTLAHCQDLLNFFNPKLVKSINLLYRASENNFQVSKFHQNCDNIPHTLTLCLNQFNSIIGGYTPLMWCSNKTDQVKDQTGSSFIFSLSKNHKFTLKDKEKNNAILRQNRDGPIFGGVWGPGADLHICDKANQKKYSYAKISCSYSNQNYSFNDCKSINRFIGNENQNPKVPSSHYFLLKQCSFEVKINTRALPETKQIA